MKYYPGAELQSRRSSPICLARALPQTQGSGLTAPMTGTLGFNTPKCPGFEDRRAEGSVSQESPRTSLRSPGLGAGRAGSLLCAGWRPKVPSHIQGVSGAWETLVLFNSKINGHNVDFKKISRFQKTSKPTESVHTNKNFRNQFCFKVLICSKRGGKNPTRKQQKQFLDFSRLLRK